MANVRLESATRLIVGQDDGKGTPPPGYERVPITDAQHAELLAAAPFQSATLSTDGVLTIVPRPPPTERLETTPEMRVKWDAAEADLAAAGQAYDAGYAEYAARRGALTATVRAATDALGQMIQAVHDGSVASHKQMMLVAQQTQMEERTRIPIEE